MWSGLNALGWHLFLNRVRVRLRSVEHLLMRLIFEWLVQRAVPLGYQLQAGVVVRGSVHELGLYKSQISNLHSLYIHSFNITGVLGF